MSFPIVVFLAAVMLACLFGAAVLPALLGRPATVTKEVGASRSRKA